MLVYNIAKLHTNRSVSKRKEGGGILSFFKYKKLEVYVGKSQSEVVSGFVKAFENEGIEYNKTLKPPNVMYDSKKEQIQFKTNDFSFTFLQVTSDPIHRLFMSLISPNSLKDSITLLSIIYTSETKCTVKNILKQFEKNTVYQPWKIRSHPRFQYAILLELLNKQKWRTFTTK